MASTPFLAIHILHTFPHLVSSTHSAVRFASFCIAYNHCLASCCTRNDRRRVRARNSGGTKKPPQNPTISDLLAKQFRRKLRRESSTPCCALTTQPASPSRFPATVSTHGRKIAYCRIFSSPDRPPQQPRRVGGPQAPTHPPHPPHPCEAQHPLPSAAEQ